MSQSHNPTDTQALVQSMLQKLKLQPGREGQSYLHTHASITAAATPEQDGEKGASDLQKVSGNSPVNGFAPNGVPPKEFRTAAVGSNVSLKHGEIQQSGPGLEVDRGLVSISTQSQSRALGQATQPAISPARTMQLFPAKSLKDAEVTSSEGTGGQMGSFSSPELSRNLAKNTYAAASEGHEQGFKPRTYLWSMKPTHFETGGQEDKGLHMGNGGFGASPQSTDTQSGSSRRTQRSSENKTRRWTQKIKEKWRDRQGSFGKKRKDEQIADQKSEQISPQRSTADTLHSTSSIEEGSALSFPDSNKTSRTPLSAEASTDEGQTRSTGDFDFGLGSFSLLDEITKGQEWARFLAPNHLAASSKPTASKELKVLPPASSLSSPVILKHQGDVKDQWDFRGSETSPDSDFSLAQISPVSMDVSEGKQQLGVLREVHHSEPMEHGHTQSGLSGPSAFVQPLNILSNSALKSRVHLNRKRQHQPAESRAEPMSSLSSGSCETEQTEADQRDSAMALHPPTSPHPHLSPTPFNPSAHPPKGVLKHSISQDSESSMEIVTKRRRVEENRRVHFSEEVVTIVPPELDADATDSEEDSEEDEDSVIEQEFEADPAAMEEVVPARRPALPAWILALKRKNTGRKHM
ncbi:uncharacterized protein V6R79_011900 [Siganus canaliculatus]